MIHLNHSGIDRIAGSVRAANPGATKWSDNPELIILTIRAANQVALKVGVRLLHWIRSLVSCVIASPRWGARTRRGSVSQLVVLFLHSVSHLGGDLRRANDGGSDVGSVVSMYQFGVQCLVECERSSFWAGVLTWSFGSIVSLSAFWLSGLKKTTYSIERSTCKKLN